MMQEINTDRLVDGLGLFLKNLSRSGFFGVVEVQFVDGQIVLVRKEETFKPAVFINERVASSVLRGRV